jgi:hypothetical protein
MAEPLIAILGSVDPRREAELKLRNPPVACSAAEAIGMELAKGGCRILVSCPSTPQAEFAEALVVRGYVKTGVAHKDSIEVHRPLRTPLPPFAEEATHAELFRYDLKESEDWAIASFLSLARADGMVILGGGQSTLIAGLVGVGYRVPMLSLAGFGGRAEEIWALLRSSDHKLATPSELALMAQPGWTADSARRCVEALLNQQKRKREGIDPGLGSERKRVITIAVVALLLFVGLLVPVAEYSRGDSLSRLLSYALFWVPALAGAVGSLVRTVLDWAQANKRLATQVPAAISVALGAVAGGVSGLFFVLAQKIAIGKLQAEQAIILLPFVLIVGLVAGLTFDKVFPKLLSLDVVRTDALQGNQPL